MKYTSITKHLCQERTTADRILARQAREEYADKFASNFSYRCGNQMRVIKTDQKVAKKYRALHPHVSN